MRYALAALIILLSSTVYGQQFYQSPLQLHQGGLGGDGPVTSAHENTHGVNSKLRQMHGGNCYYISKEGAFVRFDKTPPGITLTHVTQSCQYRGKIFNTYLVNQLQWWDDTPLYVFDEWSAYMNGSYTQLFISSDRGMSDCSIEYMLEMGYYCYVATEIMPDSWPDKPALREFWRWMAERSIALSDEARMRGLYSQDHQRWRGLIEKLLR